MNRNEFIKCMEISQGSLRRFLVSLCSGDVTLAEDLAQEAFIKAFMAIDKIETTGNFKAWIIRIAYNTFLNYTRREHTYLPLEEINCYESLQNADESFRYDDLYDALSSLSIRDRTALTLFYLEGYSTKEISGILDLKEDAVRKTLSRGRKRLRNLIS